MNADNTALSCLVKVILQPTSEALSHRLDIVNINILV